MAQPPIAYIRCWILGRANRKLFRARSPLPGDRHWFPPTPFLDRFRVADQPGELVAQDLL